MKLDFDLCWQNIQRGDESTFENVYKATFSSLVYYANEITRQPQLSEEVVQDVFSKIWQNRSELHVKGSFKAYLFQSVHNLSLNAIRHKKTNKESVNLLSSETTWKFISDTYDLNDNLIERIISDETELIIEHIVEELPEQCRKVFIMSRFESLKNKEIEAQLGLTENTVKTHIYRALQKIAFALKKEK